MSFIERAVKRIEERHFSGPEVGRAVPIDTRPVKAEPDSVAEVVDIAGLGEESTGSSPVENRTKTGVMDAAIDEETLIPKSADVIDEEDSSDAGKPERHLSPDTDSDLNDEALGQDQVDTYTGAVFRNTSDRVRAAHVRALRAKIDQVEASVDEATVSLPPAPVRAARAASAGMAGVAGLAGLAGAGAVDDDQPPVLSMRNVVRDSALADEAVADGSAPAEEPDSAAPDSATAISDANQGKEAKETEREPLAVAPAKGSGGKLNLNTIRAQAYLDPNGREDRMREAFEPMADELLEQMAADAAATTPMGRRIMLTSAEHGVGRSLCGVHLALSLAVDHGQTVCYIDVDFSGTPILPDLGVRTGAGVADWLDGQVQTIEALVVPTELAGLKLIGQGSAGAISRRTVRLDRQSMNAFLLAFSARYPDDLVVMGAPALDDEANATMLAGLAGQVVVVVEANKTPRKQLAKALNALQRHSRVSLMLNKIKR